ncbi:hypothetical protein [Dehalobacterium formicoaceticum]|uniref:Uncharacterized protein n=1 Tax=Dehalobacterium formicoaceticum TaxID=51515 RepID=A0ABT1Y495_9FIRM|nr:hypothetical protein [Dehalobacterium formicoaceticum]MCR6545691.1 hypothetical protein [Dehalobacterium formicoaceticum]
MRYDGCNDGDRKKRDNDCNCTIKIEDSIVIILCGDIDEDNLKKSLAGAREAREVR